MAEDEANDDEYVKEEEEVTVVPGWAPSVTLDVKDQVDTGEEDEEQLYSQRSKLFRYRDGEWKERGLGEAKLLKHKTSGKVRFILRQEKTMKIVANHYVIDHPPYCQLKPNMGNDKCWVWSAHDSAEDESCVEQFALKFGKPELAKEFETEFDKAKQLNAAAGFDFTEASGDAEGNKEAARPAVPVSSSPAPSLQSASPQKDEKEKPAEANPFAGMSLFGGSTGGGLFASGSSSVATGGLFASAASSGGGPFSSLSFNAAASTGGGIFGASSGGGLFASVAPAAKPADSQGGQEDEQGQYVPEEEVTTVPGWAPTVSLEVHDKIETGEEDEEELYSQRSKLYRFRDGEWKERGLGEAKLLQHKETKKVRFILRQEETMKIVANHYVIKVASYCDLRPNQGSDKCWVWIAQDYSEEVPVVENFALKFGSVELAQTFKEAFDDAKEKNAALESFSDLAAGKDSAEDDRQEAGDPSTSDAPKLVANPLASGSTFAPPERESATSGGLFSGVANGGLFGGSGSGLLGGATGSGGGLFGLAPAVSGGLFSSVGGATEVVIAAGQEGDDEYVAEEEVTTVPGWSPSVSLEVKETIETGEENEEQLYSQKSKLYRFRDGEWKERGLGEAKLLKHKQSGKVRFILRQEKTMKIVANHYVVALPPYCDLQPNAGSPKCWVWIAQDFADEETQVERLALKFGTPDLATKFKEAFDNAKVLNVAVPEFAALVAEGAAASPKLSASPTAEKPEGKNAEEATAAGVKSAEGGKASEPAANSFSGISLNSTTPEVSGSTATASSGGTFNLGGLFSGSTTTTAAGSSGGGLFGTTGGSLSGLFSGSGGASTGAPSTGGIFSGAGATTGGGLFSFASTGGLFSSAAASSSSASSGGASIGGGLSFSFASTGGLFSSAAASSSSASSGGASIGGGLLGGGAATGGGLFGSTGNLFGNTGGNLLGSASSGGGLFGNASGSGSGLFDGASSGGGLFGGSGGGLFGSAASGGNVLSGAISGGASLFGGSGGGSVLQPLNILSGGKSEDAKTGDDKQTGAGEGGEDDQYVPEEEVTSVPGWAPSVTLQVREKVETGEEDEEELYTQRSKLLRFRDGDWKERGTGEAKILKHRQTGKVRFLLRQEKTMKIVANFMIVDKAPYCDLRPNAGSKKCWVWSALDWSEEEQVAEQFALKFGSEELAQAFKAAFDAAKSGNRAPAAAKSAAPAVPVNLTPAPKAKAQANFPTATNGAAAKIAQHGNEGEWTAEEWQQWGYGDEDAECYEDYEAYYDDAEDQGAGGGGSGGAGSLSWMAEQQNASGWRCTGCRLQWGEDVIECGVCEIPRPGYEEKVKAKQADKAKGQAAAAAAFLGASTTDSKAPAPTVFGGFGAGAAQSGGILFGNGAATGGGLFGAGGVASASSETPGAVAKSSVCGSSGGSLFGGAAAASSGSSIFSSAAIGSGLFGAGVASSTPAAGATVPTPSKAPPAAMAFGGASSLMPPPPPPAVAAGGLGFGQGPHVVPPKFGMPASGVPPPPPPANAPAVAPAAATFAPAGAFDATAFASALGATLAAALPRVPAAGGDEQLRRLEDEMREQRRREDERARAAEERARRLEEEVGSLRQMLRKQEETRIVERPAAGATTEATLQSVLAVAQMALKVAEGAQQQVLQIRQERSADASVVAERFDALEERLNRRFDEFEANTENRQLENPVRALSLGDKIAHSTRLHQQRTLHRLGADGNVGAHTADALKPADGASAALGALFRRH